MKDLSVLTKENYHQLLTQNGYTLKFEGSDYKIYEKKDWENSRIYKISVDFYDWENEEEIFDAYYWRAGVYR